jgi:hypothetical protein
MNLYTPHPTLPLKGEGKGGGDALGPLNPLGYWVNKYL